MAVNQVVGVNSEEKTNVFGMPSSGAVSGSGFIISNDGYIVTNYHVISYAVEQGFTLTVMTHDGKSYPAKVIGYEQDNDLAVIKIDATGLMVLPGGVDVHCHIDQVSSTGLVTADDFYTGGVSAACGGTTTIVPFAAQHRGQSLIETVTAYHQKAAPKAFVDYGFHLIVSDPRPEVLGDELPAMVEQGCPSLKVYMTYDALRLSDRQMLDVLGAARALGARVMVHAENHDAIAWITNRLLASGCTLPRHHPASRPAVVEREATHRAIALAEIAGAPLHIVHVSSAEALDEVRRGRARGAEVTAETCPQYLVLKADDLDRPGFEGAKLMCSPPPRDEASQRALWQGLADGVLAVFASDHAPYRFDDPQGKKVHGEDAPFTRIPNGVPSLELRLPLLYSLGVAQGRLDLHRFVAVTATEPARLFGLYPRKGTIAVGSDADLALWDPQRHTIVTSLALHDRMDYTPFEGLHLTGWPIVTISRGEVIWAGGTVFGRAGRGRFLARDRLTGATTSS
jgi:dihydropyrimidinase